MNQNYGLAATKAAREEGGCETGRRAHAAQPVQHRKLNFLMIDDDDICLFIHRRVLELSGYCNLAHSARNGQTGLEILKMAVEDGLAMPDVILLDLEMPVMNGIAFLEGFQRLDCPDKDRISIVLLTSSVSVKDREYAMSLGVSQFLSKPFTSEGLESIISTLC